MPFLIIGRTVPGMRQVVGFKDPSTGRGTFGCEFGARQCVRWGLTAYVCDSASTVGIIGRTGPGVCYPTSPN